MDTRVPWTLEIVSDLLSIGLAGVLAAICEGTLEGDRESFGDFC